jgi:hypothetical protein
VGDEPDHCSSPAAHDDNVLNDRQVAQVGVVEVDPIGQVKDHQQLQDGGSGDRADEQPDTQPAPPGDQ